MNKIQKILIKNWFFPILTILIITFLFIYLSPKLSNILIPGKQQSYFNNFVAEIMIKGNLDPIKFWKFREFYSPGTFVFNREGIDKAQLNPIMDKIKTTKKPKLSFLYFSAPKLKSVDSLTNETNLHNIILLTSLKSQNIVIYNQRVLIYKLDNKNYFFAFLFNNKQMQETNGFLDYKDKDSKITKNQNWLSISVMEAE